MSSDIAGKNVLFLVKDKANIATTATFLDRRDLNTYIVTDLKEAIRIMDNTPPDFLCLSVNYPHPKVLHIPKLISSTFAVETIVLSEKPDRKSDMTLSQAKSRNILYGSVSGPSLLMKIRRVIKDQVEQEKIKKQNAQPGSSQGAQVIKSTQPRKKETYHLQSNSGEDQKSTSSDSKQKNKTMMFKSENSHTGPATYNPQLEKAKQKAQGEDVPGNEIPIDELFAKPSSDSPQETAKNLDPFKRNTSDQGEPGADFTDQKKTPFENIEGSQSLEEALEKSTSSNNDGANTSPFAKSDSDANSGLDSADQTEEETPESSAFTGLLGNTGGLFGLPTEDEPVNEPEVPKESNSTMEQKEVTRPPSVAEQVAQMQKNSEPRGSSLIMPDSDGSSSRQQTSQPNGQNQGATTQSDKSSGYVGIDQQITKGNKPVFKDSEKSESSASNTDTANSKQNQESAPHDDMFSAEAEAAMQAFEESGQDINHQEPSENEKKPQVFDPFAALEKKESEGNSSEDKKSSADYKEHRQESSSDTSSPELEKKKALGEGVFVGKKGETKDPFENQKMAEAKRKSLTEQDLNYFRNSIDLAIKQTCDLTDKDVVPIKNTERLGFIPINSGKYQGYITVAITEESSLRSTLLTELGRNISENLGEMGEEIFTDEAVIIDIYDPELIKWAKESGQIILVSRHKNSELIISYISKEKALPIIIEASSDMEAIDVIDIEPEKSLEYETYLHMPQNNKYIKYGKTGGAFTEKQIKRLKKEADGRLHIKKKDNYSYKKSYIESEVHKDLKKFKKAD